MRLSTKLCVLAAAGALTAATAVPALALENEFHGMYKLQFINSNFNSGQGGVIEKDAPTNNIFEQRARLMYIAKANDSLKLVTHFEIDSFWGKSSYAIDRQAGGGALGADTVNLETKSVYLDFMIPATKVNVKAGIQPYTDAFKGILVDADMAGVIVSSSIDKLSYSLGFFRWDDNSIDPNKTINAADGSRVSLLTNDIVFTNGKKTRDFFVVDSKYELSKSAKVGASYYATKDDKNGSITHTLGVNGEAGFGPVVLDGFLVYQTGSFYPSLTTPVGKHVNAFAGNVNGKVKAGPGTARAGFLYAAGGSNAFVAEQTGESDFYDHEMVILGRDKNGMTIDNAIVYDINNGGNGVIFGNLGYDMSFTDKLSASANLGFAAVAKDEGTVGPLPGGKHHSNYLGTEVNAEINYKLYDSLTTGMRFGYVFLGDYFKGTSTAGADPDNPYDLKIIVSYAF